MTFKVFISASVKDSAIVEDLRNALNRYGIVSILSSDIPLGALIERFVRQQIFESDCFLAIIGKGGDQSENVSREMDIAKSLAKIVIPVVEQDAYIPREIAGIQYISISRDNPKLSYEHAAEYLSKLKMEKEQKSAIGGLVLLGLGLLLLGAIASSE